MRSPGVKLSSTVGSATDSVTKGRVTTNLASLSRPLLLKTTSMPSQWPILMRRKHDKLVRGLQKKRIDFTTQMIEDKEVTCEDISESPDYWDKTVLHSGVACEYPWLAHANLSRIINEFCSKRMLLSDWTFDTDHKLDEQTRQNMPFLVMTVADLFPFKRTFPQTYGPRSEDDVPLNHPSLSDQISRKKKKKLQSRKDSRKRSKHTEEADQTAAKQSDASFTSDLGGDPTRIDAIHEYIRRQQASMNASKTSEEASEEWSNPYGKKFNLNDEDITGYQWKWTNNPYVYDGQDSVDRDLPRLVRRLPHNGRKQEVIIYREVSYDTISLMTLPTICQQFRPSAVVLAKSKMSHNLSKLFRTFHARKFQSRVGIMANLTWSMHTTNGLMYCKDPSKITKRIRRGKVMNWLATKVCGIRDIDGSYATQAAIDYCAQNAQVKSDKLTIPALVLGDLNHNYLFHDDSASSTSDLSRDGSKNPRMNADNNLSDLVQLLDLYAMNASIESSKLCDWSVLTQPMNFSQVPLKVYDQINLKLKPYSYMVNCYRNDVLAAAINELDERDFPQILVICDAFRAHDLISCLTGERQTNRLIHKVDHKDESVTMSKLPPSIGIGGYSANIPHENTIERMCILQELWQIFKYFGPRNTAFILTEQRRDDSMEDLHDAVDHKGEFLRNLLGNLRVTRRERNIISPGAILNATNLWGCRVST